MSILEIASSGSCKWLPLGCYGVNPELIAICQAGVQFAAGRRCGVGLHRATSVCAQHPAPARTFWSCA